MAVKNEMKLYGIDEQIFESEGRALKARADDLLFAPAFVEKYDNSTLIDVRINREFSPISLELPVGSIEAAMNALESSEATSAAKVVFMRGGKKVGTFFNASGTNNLRGAVTIRALDVVARLKNTRFLGRFIESESAKQLIETICEEAQIPVEFEVESVQDPNGITVLLDDIFVSGYLHGGAASDALVKICFACGFSVKPTADGAIKILPSVVDGEPCPIDEVSINSKIEYLPYFSDFSISRNKYVLDKTSDKETVLSETLSNGLYRYEFDEPHARYEIKNGVIEDSGSNFVEFGVTAESADVEIKGSPYKKIVLLERFSNPLQTGAKNVYELSDIEIASNVGGEMGRLFWFLSGNGRKKGVQSDILLDSVDKADENGLQLQMAGTEMNVVPESMVLYFNSNPNVYCKLTAREVDE